MVANVCFELGYKYESYESASKRIENDIDTLVKKAKQTPVEVI